MRIRASLPESACKMYLRSVTAGTSVSPISEAFLCWTIELFSDSNLFLPFRNTIMTAATTRYERNFVQF